MMTRVLGVRTGNEDEDVTVCVLLLPGAMRKNDAGTGEAAMSEASGAGALDDGEVLEWQACVAAT